MKRKLKDVEDECEETSEKKAKSDEETSEEVTLKEFDVKKFRHKLKTGNFFDQLKLFNKIASKTQEIIFDFISAGGKPLEIVETIKSHEEAGIDILSNLYTMLHLVVQNIINDDNQRLESTAQALKYFVNKNASSINKMLSSSKVSDKITTLKLLTVAIKVDREIGYDILKSIQLFSKANENKSDLSCLEDDVKAKKSAKIRPAFVEFFMSFLLRETDVVMSKKILHKRGIFEFFLQGLHQDDYETIKEVLSCLTKNVLISPGFSKPEKLKIFTDDAIKYLLKLYEWKGPEEEKENVVNLAHHFLILLLTNRKHGIAFKGLTEHRQNMRQLQVLGIFKNVWMYEHPPMLIIEIVKSCPDLMQNLLNRLTTALVPRVTQNWFMCINFTKKLISEIDPVEMSKLICSLEAKKISNNIIRFSISQFILQHLNESALIQQDNLVIREIATNLLNVMLTKCCGYLEELTKMDTLKDFEKHRIRFDIINHLFTFFPHIDIILNSLYRSIVYCKRNSSDENKQLVKSQLKSTLNILLLLIESFPATIEKIPSVIDYLETLRQIYEYQLNAVEDVDHNENLEIEMKIVKIILSLQPNILSADSKFFDRIFTIMVKVYCSSTNEDYRKEARLLLFRIIKNVGNFSSICDLEISVWLEALRSIKTGILQESIVAILKVLKSNKNLHELNFKWSNEVDKMYDKNFFNMINSAEEDDEKPAENNFQLSFALPLLLQMKSDQLNRIIEFVEVMIILLYHSFPEMKKSLVELLKQDRLELNTNILSYIKKKSLNAFDDILIGYDNLTCKNFQKAIIDGNEFKENFDSDTCQILIMQGLFCAIKLARNDQLTDEKIERIGKHMERYFTKLLTVDKKNSANEADDEKVEKAANRIFGYESAPASDTLVSYIFEHYTALLDSFDIHEMNQLTKFIEKLLVIFKGSDNLDKKLQKYSSKIILQFKEIDSVNDSILSMIEKFPFSCHQYHEFIDIILGKEVNETTLKGIKLCIDKINSTKGAAIPSKQIKNLEKVYVHTALNTPYDLSSFEQIFKSYLSVYPHSIADISSNIFEIIFQDDVTVSKAHLQLIAMLFNHKSEWNEIFIEKGLKIKKEFLYPLLHIAFNKNIIKEDMLKPLYAEFKSGIIRAIEKPAKAAQIYRENVESSIQLINHAMPQNECRDLASKKFKFESSAVFQVKMLHAIFTKAYEKEEERNDQYFYNFINHWVNLFGLAESKDYGEYMEVISKWLEHIPTDENGLKLYGDNWSKFYTTCLKNGLKSNESSNMLVILGKIISVMSIEPKEVATIFDMIFTHSNFFNLSFNVKSTTKKWKRNMFYLLNVLVQKNPDVAHEKHVPIYLSSYQATMSSSDQLVLNLLRFYEIRCGIDLHDYSPLLFGHAALTHFTSHEHDELKFVKNTSLDKMDAVFFKLLNLFEKSVIENTLNNYPIKRQLAGMNLTDLNELLINDGDDRVYDPGYFLPLFEMILTTSTFKFLSVAVKNELMSLIIPALSCEDENMRLLAAHVLLKCRENTEGKKKTREIWVKFYDLMQKGLAEVKEGTRTENKDEKHFPRAANVSTRILAEISRIIPNKLHPTYSIICNYLIMKEKFEFATIPELLALFHSSDVQHEENRLFLLNMINNGISDNLDFKVLNNTPFLKIILSCYGCPLSNRKLDLLILKIIDKLVTNTDKTQFLIEKYGLGLWLFQNSVGVEPFEYDILEMLLTLIEHVYKVSKTNQQIQKILNQSLLILFRKFTKTKLTIQSFLNYLTVVNGINQVTRMNDEDTKSFLDISSVFIPMEYMQHLMYLWTNPEASKYLESDKAYRKTITTDEVTRNVAVEVRKFIINFNRIKRRL